MKYAKQWMLSLLFLLVLTVPAHAAGEGEVLWFSAAEPVWSINATYSFRAENVAAIEVQFFCSGAYTDYNWKDGYLMIAIASAKPLNLSEPLATVTARETDGTETLLELTLTNLLFNGQIATGNPWFESVTAVATAAGTQVTVILQDNFPGSSYWVMAAAYDEHEKMLGCQMQLVAAERISQAIELKLPGGSGSKAVKVFLLTETLHPITAAQRCELK